MHPGDHEQAFQAQHCLCLALKGSGEGEKERAQGPSN